MRDRVLGAGASEVEALTRGVRELSFVVFEDESATGDEDALAGLDETQRRCVRAAVAGENMFITGVGGTGKSKVLRAIRAALRASGRRTATGASTGIAAQAVSGTTLFAMCGLGPMSTIGWPIGSASPLTAQLLRQYDCVLVDEVSMLSGEFFDRLSFHLQQIRQDRRPCGGLQMILFGDFLQLGPIDETSKRHKSGRGFCPGLQLSRGWMFESWTWDQLNIKTVVLERVYRQLGELEFIETLKGVRVGDAQACKKLDEMLKTSSASSKTMASALRLVATNNEAKTVNDRELAKLRSTEYTWNARDSVEVSETIEDPKDMVMCEKQLQELWKKQLEKQCRVDKVVKLKQGSKVMMLKNSSASVHENGESVIKPLPNGSRGYICRMAPGSEVIQHLRERVNEIESALARKANADSREDPLKAEAEAAGMKRQLETYNDHIEWIQSEAGQGKEVVVPMVVFDSLPNISIPVLPVEFTFETVGLGKNIRKQIPLTLAYAVTIHKSQGMTLKRVHVECASLFAEGQAYVAFSRATSITGLTANGFDPSKVKVSKVAKEFHSKQGLNTRRGWWLQQPNADPHARVLDSIIQKRGGDARHVLDVAELRERCTVEKWKCNSCGHPYRACYEIRDVVDSTIRRSDESMREGLDGGLDEANEDSSPKREATSGDVDRVGSSYDSSQVMEEIRACALLRTCIPTVNETLIEYFTKMNEKTGNSAYGGVVLCIRNYEQSQEGKQVERGRDISAQYMNIPAFATKIEEDIDEILRTRFETAVETGDVVDSTIRRSDEFAPTRPSVEVAQTTHLTGSARRTSDRDDIAADGPDGRESTRVRMEGGLDISLREYQEVLRRRQRPERQESN